MRPSPNTPEFCEDHQGFRYSSENCMLEGAIEKILAEEDCYPQFHARYFMSQYHLKIELNFTSTFVRSENAKSVIVGVDAFHQEGLEQVRHLQGGSASSVQGHSEQVVHVGNGESVVRVVVLNIASTQSPQIWDPVHGHNATCLSSCTDQTNLVQTTMAKYPAK